MTVECCRYLCAESSGWSILSAAPAHAARIATNVPSPLYGAASVWGLTASGRELVRIDPASNTVSASIRLPGPAGVLTVTDSAVWVGDDGPGSHLWKIDPATNQVVGQVKLGPAGETFGDLSAGDDGSVWVSLFESERVLRVRPTS